MATGFEHILLLITRGGGSLVIVSVLGLAGYIVGGSLVLSLETFELAFPFLQIDRDPILNLLFLVAGIGMTISSIPLLTIAILFSPDSIDSVQLVLSWILGTLGIAVTKLSLPVVGSLLP